MTTLIALYNRHGCVGRCDEKCYKAKNETCTCICGGINHGVGLAKAALNIEENLQELLDSAKQFHTLSRMTFPLGHDQGELF